MENLNCQIIICLNTFRLDTGSAAVIQTFHEFHLNPYLKSFFSEALYTTKDLTSLVYGILNSDLPIYEKIDLKKGN